MLHCVGASLVAFGPQLWLRYLVSQGFTPTEMLHWVGTSLVAASFQIWLWYLVLRGHGSQNDAEQEVIIIPANLHCQCSEIWKFSLDHRHAAVNTVLCGEIKITAATFLNTGSFAATRSDDDTVTKTDCSHWVKLRQPIKTWHIMTSKISDICEKSISKSIQQDFFSLDNLPQRMKENTKSICCFFSILQRINYVLNIRKDEG